MKKLRIGYVPNSKNLDAPGDRRRIVFWAKARGHEIVTNLDDNFDAIKYFLSSSCRLYLLYCF